MAAFGLAMDFREPTPGMILKWLVKGHRSTEYERFEERMEVVRVEKKPFRMYSSITNLQSTDQDGETYCVFGKSNVYPA